MLKTSIALLFILPAVAAFAQAPPLPAEPTVTLKAGETPVSGQCLTREELDLNKGLEALKRPTRGAENPDHDDQPRFNPQYFVGQWRIEGVLPESPFGPAGDYTGTETIRHVDGCTYEGPIQANLSGRAYSVKIRMFYDRKAHYLVRVEDDSRGFQLVKAGLVGARRRQSRGPDFLGARVEVRSEPPHDRSQRRFSTRATAAAARSSRPACRRAWPTPLR